MYNIFWALGERTVHLLVVVALVFSNAKFLNLASCGPVSVHAKSLLSADLEVVASVTAAQRLPSLREGIRSSLRERLTNLAGMCYISN